MNNPSTQRGFRYSQRIQLLIMIGVFFVFGAALSIPSAHAQNTTPSVQIGTDSPDPITAGGGSTFTIGWEDTDSATSWTQATARAQFSVRSIHTSVVFNSAMWVIGGSASVGCVGGSECNDVWYSTDGITWTQATAAAQWSERYGHTSLVFNNRMWVIGGYDGNQAGGCVGSFDCSDVWYSTDGVDWTQATAAAQWSDRHRHTSLVFLDSMWVFGGFDNDAGGCAGSFKCNDVWYSTDGVDWTLTTAAAQWSERYLHTSLVFNSAMWVIGGYDENQASGCVGSFDCNDVWYSTDGVDWTQATAAAQWSERRRPTSLVFNNQMWVIGGDDVDISGGCVSTSMCNDVWYSTDGVDWTLAAATAQWPARQSHTSFVFNNQIWVIGGNGSGAGNDVWYSSGEQVKAFVCKTDSITNAAGGGDCDASQEWIASTSTSTSDPITLSYTTTSSDVDTNNYYVFVCDDSGSGNACSSSTSGTFTVLAAAGSPGAPDTTTPEPIQDFSATFQDDLSSPSGQAVLLTWTNPSDADFFQVRIYRSTNTSFIPSTATEIVQVPGSPSSPASYLDTDIEPGITYTYLYQILTEDILSNLQAGLFYPSVSVTIVTPAEEVIEEDEEPEEEPEEEFTEEEEPSSINPGDLIRGEGANRVYLVNEHGYKRHIFNPAIFNLYGYDWGNVKEVSQEVLDAYPSSLLYRTQHGYRVFTLEEVDEQGGTALSRHLNITPAQFEEQGHAWEQIFIINEEEHEYYQQGEDIVSNVSFTRV